jgi:hypothetical protein
MARRLLKLKNNFGPIKIDKSPIQPEFPVAGRVLNRIITARIIKFQRDGLTSETPVDRIAAI